MQFFVLGVDGPEFGESDILNEAHWSYMDGWADALVARGPTCSVDGGRHSGSLHVVDLPDDAAAARFVLEEPYYRAGWYSMVEVIPVFACLDGTMWDRPPADPDVPSALIRILFEHDRGLAEDLAASVRQQLEGHGSNGWIYLGVTSSASGQALGLVGLADTTPTAADQLAVDLLRAVGVAEPNAVSQPWVRGGRPS